MNNMINTLITMANEIRQQAEAMEALTSSQEASVMDLDYKIYHSCYGSAHNCWLNTKESAAAAMDQMIRALDELQKLQEIVTTGQS